MSEYISTFTTGFNEIIRRALTLSLPGCRIIAMYDGLINYHYSGNPADICAISYLNNSFHVIRKFQGNRLNFNYMTREITKKPLRLVFGKGSFRVRFSKENRFEKVDDQVVSNVERTICRDCGMTVDRVNPQQEFWFIIRRENVGFFGQLLLKRQHTEKNLHKGELRPEFASLMGAYANASSSDIVCDPFAGYGSIPTQLVKQFGVKRMLINDLDRICYDSLKRIPLFNRAEIRITNEDALSLESIQSQSVDVIVTDPPWGYYEKMNNIQAFYEEMLKSFRRILKPDGRAIVLSARKEELKQAALNEGITIVEKLDTLVNGKKAALFCLKF